MTTITRAERDVVIQRRRKKHAPPGRKQEAAFRLKMAVTAALREAGNAFLFAKTQKDRRCNTRHDRAA